MIVRRIGNPRTGWMSPFNDFDYLRRDMLRLLDQVGHAAGAYQHAGVFPALNVTQDKDSFHVRAELPGVRAEDLELSAVGHTLTISGTRSAPKTEGVSYHRKERPQGRFSRSISLPSEFDSERVSAQLTDGLLTITLPKPEKLKPRQISVKTA